MSWAEEDPAALWPVPDLSILQSGEREPPQLPLEVFGSAWADWITAAADASACPVDYVAAPLLASVSVLIGNARWVKATELWVEPPHLWIGVVGNSGNGKSPGADPLMRWVLPEMERRMAADFPDKLREWEVVAELTRAREEDWKRALREAVKKGVSPPVPPQRAIDLSQRPQQPRLRSNDVTIEKVGMILAIAAPKGVLLVRDELAGWIDGMAVYNASARKFWLEAFGGRRYEMDRQKYDVPIVIPRLAVATYGGTQPGKLALLMRDLDDGLMARFLWTWPKPVKFRIGRAAPKIDWAIDALDRLRELDLGPDGPVMLPLVDGATSVIDEFGQEMQRRQDWAGGLMSSALGKARGQALRLALGLEHLWWCGATGFDGPPTEISERAVVAAAGLMDEYFMPMAERVYGDATLPEAERLTTTLARWIWRRNPIPEIVNAKEVRRLKLPGLREAEKVAIAINGLIEADWLRPIPSRVGGTPGRQRADYAVNPRLKREKADE